MVGMWWHCWWVCESYVGENVVNLLVGLVEAKWWGCGGYVGGFVEAKWWGCGSYFGGFVETWRWWLYW